MSRILSTGGGGGRVWLLGGMCGCWGVCMVAGGHAWLQGGMHGCEGHTWLRGHAWLLGEHAWLLGGMHGCWGACMVAGGMHGCWGACMVAGGMHGCGGCVWLLGGMCGCGRVHRIRRDRVNKRVVRILLECILVIIMFSQVSVCSWGCLCQGDPLDRRGPPGERPSWAETPGQWTPPPRLTVMCGRYGSYWNAFLLLDLLAIVHFSMTKFMLHNLRVNGIWIS